MTCWKCDKCEVTFSGTGNLIECVYCAYLFCENCWEKNQAKVHAYGRCIDL